VTRLRVNRIARGWTQSQLAEIVGVHRHTIQHLENGHRVPSRENAERIAEALDTTVDWLFPEGVVAVPGGRLPGLTESTFAERYRALLEDPRLAGRCPIEAGFVLKLADFEDDEEAA
jgi:transcriptional regulator with XRE-family HTH domain